jgi:hypothetical protein
MDTFAELVSFLGALKDGGLIAYLILLAPVLIVFAVVMAAVEYQRVRIKRFKAAAEAQEEFEAIAVKLRKRALEMKERDDDLRKREPEVKRRDNDRRQQALKESVSHVITLGLKDNQNRLLQIDLKGMLSSVHRKRNAAA